MATFLRGATAMGCAAAALVFLRFYRQSIDRFFLFFSLAFVILAIDYAVLGLVSVATEWRVYVFTFRLAAFVLILLAIGQKNSS
jgi:hypothetical protein